MVNYFPYDYPAPAPGQAFRHDGLCHAHTVDAGTRLVTICLQGELPA